MKPANGAHIIRHIKDTLKEHAPHPFRMIEQGEIVLLTRRQLEMRSPAAFEAIVSDYVAKHDVSWKTAYTLVEHEHIEAYGQRQHTSYKSFMNSRYQRKKIQ